MATIDSGVNDDSLISPQTLLNNIISAPPIETLGFLYFSATSWDIIVHMYLESYHSIHRYKERFYFIF